MADVDGPRHAKQLLSHVRGVTRRVLRWAFDGQTPYLATGLEIEEAEKRLTEAIKLLESPAKLQQERERGERERVRNGHL